MSLLVLHSVNPRITSQSTGLREKIRWVAGYVLCKKKICLENSALYASNCYCCFFCFVALNGNSSQQHEFVGDTLLPWYSTAPESCYMLYSMCSRHTHMYQVPHMWDLLMCARLAWSHAWKENPDRTLVWTHVARQVERGGTSFMEFRSHYSRCFVKS